MSPFVVNSDKDVGYLGYESLAGGRLSTELLKTPSDVTVLTKDFLTDISATNYQEAANFLPNAYTTPQLNTDFANAVTFRGLTGGFPTRNYFRYINVIDYFVAERVEGARGPNAILFGDGAVGGVLNTMTKRANLARSFTELALRADSEGSFRATLDVNRPLGGKAALRLNLLNDEDRSWINGYRRERRGIQLAATYRFSPRTELRFETEFGRFKTNSATQSVIDSVSVWNGVPFVGPSTTNPPGAAGVGRYTADRLVFGPAFNGVVNLRDFGNTQGTGFRIDPSKAAFIPNLPGVARNFNLQPPNALGDIRYNVTSLFFEHRWSDRLISEVAVQYAQTLRAELSSRWQSYEIDINTTLPGGAPNPNYGAVFSDAQPKFFDKDNTHVDYRFVTAYTLPVERWRQVVNFLASRRYETFDAVEFQYGRANGSVANLTDSSNAVFYRQYWRDRPVNVPLRPANQAGFAWDRVTTRDFRQTHRFYTLQLATTANFWDDKITFIGGLRRDIYYGTASNIGTTDAQGNPNPGGRAIAPILDFPTDTKSAGLVVFPIPQLGAYFNYSETFNPIGGGHASLTNRNFDATFGTGYSGGLRFKLFDGRLVGSLGYYDTEETGRIATAVPTSFIEINRIWTNLNRNDRTLPSDYRDTNDQGGSGYELDFVAQASGNFRLRGTLAFPETRQSNALPDTRQYLAANLATWQAGLSDPAVTNPAQIASDIATIQSRIQASAEGRKLNGQPDYSGSLFGTYTFAAGAFKGASVGGGVTFLGPRIIGNAVGDSYSYIKSDAYYSATLTAAYAFKLNGRNIRLQLNINNALNNDDPFYTATRPFNGVAYRDAYYYPEPRKLLLSVTLDL